MIKFFKYHIVTKKELDVINERIDSLVVSINDLGTEGQTQDRKLSKFAVKFDNSMDFIGRNLPLKRKRKAFFKIVK